MRIGDAIKAMKLVKKLENKGMVSAVWPPENFMVSDKLSADEMQLAERALVFYAKACIAVLIATYCVKFVAVAAMAVILVTAIQ